MKKILVLLFMVYLSSVAAMAAIPEDRMKYDRPMQPKMTEQQRAEHEKAFEQRLGLTEEQIQKSKELRIEGREKIKPVIDKIKSKEQEIEAVKKAELTEQERTAKLNSLISDLKSLHKQAHDIRIENMKNFEGILTPEQQKTLKEMRQEGRKNFNHKRPMPCPPHKK